MHAVYELKQKLCEELEEYGQKRELSAGSLDIIDKLAHTIKNLDKILECYEEESGRSFDSGYSYRSNGRRGYSNGRSYSDGRTGMYSGDSGRNRIQYTGDYYSRGGEIIEKLRRLMEDAPDERTRQEIQSLIYRIEGM